jgi:hypothetical protein
MTPYVANGVLRRWNVATGRSNAMATQNRYMDRIFKPPFSMTGAISQDRERCQFLFCLIKNPLLYQAARPESGREVREMSLMAPLARTQSERRRRLALAAVLVAQIVWNRSTRRAGVRGGARVGRPRWLRILTITGGSSMAALRRGSGDDLQSAAAVRAVLDVEDPFE